MSKGLAQKDFKTVDICSLYKKGKTEPNLYIEFALFTMIFMIRALKLHFC